MAALLVFVLLLGGLPPASAAKPDAGVGVSYGSSDAFDDPMEAIPLAEPVQASLDGSAATASTTELSNQEASVLDPSAQVQTVKADYRSIPSGLEVTLAGNYSSAVQVALPSAVIERSLAYPALDTYFFSFQRLDNVSVYLVGLPNLTATTTIIWHEFTPGPQPVFTLGSPLSVLLERPMSIRLAGVPGWEAVAQAASDSNGSAPATRYSARLLLAFDGPDHTGQTVRFSRSWLLSYGISHPRITHDDGSPIQSSIQGQYVIAVVDHFSGVVIDNFESSAWIESKSGGSSFVAASTSGSTEDAFRSPPKSMLVAFGSGGGGTDWGSVLRYYDMTFTDMQMLRVWMYAEKYKHDGSSWDSLDAGVRLRLYNSGGTNFATYQYWLAAWYHASDTRTPDANSKLVWGKPPIDKWTEFVAYPKTDWSGANWASVTKIRVELYASAAGTVGDSLMLYFDDFSFGVKTTKVTYIWSGTLQRDQVWTNSLSESFTVPSNALYLKAWLSMPPVGANLDLSLYDEQGRRTGGYIRTDRATRTNIPNSQYSGRNTNPQTVTVSTLATSGTWKAAATLTAGNGNFEIRVELYSSESLSAGVQGTQFYFSVDNPAYKLDTELRFPSGYDYDLSVWNAAGQRTGGGVPGDGQQRYNIPYSSYSGWLTNPEWVFVDPPTGAGNWHASAYVYSGSGPYDLDMRAEEKTAFWSVNLHDGDVDDNIALARGLLDSQVVPLGVGMVRTDFPWTTIEPTQDSYNVDFFRLYASAARVRGLDVVAILEINPSWAQSLYTSNKPAYFNQLEEFCKVVASEVGAYVDMYQISNEENYPLNNMVTDDNDLPTLSARCMNGLVAGESAAATGHERWFKTAINANGDIPLIPPYWWDWLTTWVNGAPSSIDIIGVDHYPGTKQCIGPSPYSEWSGLDDLVIIATNLGKEAAVMETGYSTGSVNPCGAIGSPEEQVKFAGETVSTLGDRVLAQNKAHPGTRYVLANWYQLKDPSGDCTLWECYFGLLDSSGNRKVGYAAVQAKFADFGRWIGSVSFGLSLWENQGGDVVLGDLNGNGISDAIFAVVDNPLGRNQFYYTIGWDISTGGVFSDWSPQLGMFGPFDAGGDESQGAGVAIVDVDRNGVQDAVFMAIDNPSGQNYYRYRVAFNVITSGTHKGEFGSWSSLLGGIAVGGDESQGGGVTFGDIDHNGVQDAVFMTVDNPSGSNNFRYVVGWNIGTNGNFASWSGVKGSVSAPGGESQGGGARIVDWNGDGALDLLLGVIDNPTGENTYRFIVGATVNSAGDVTGGWSQVWGYEQVPGQEDQGGGFGVGDVDRDGRLDMMFAAVDNPVGANNVRFRVRYGI